MLPVSPAGQFAHLQIMTCSSFHSSSRTRVGVPGMLPELSLEMSPSLSEAAPADAGL